MSEPIEEPEADDAGSGRKMDPELLLLGLFIRELRKLDDDEAAARIVAYIGSRWRKTP